MIHPINAAIGLVARHEGHHDDDGDSMSSMGSMSSMVASATSAATATGTAMAASASSSSSSSMAGMDMSSSSSSSSACKISMLWNWYTIDSCFLARSWHVTSKSMFGGTCVGVVFLVVLLEAIRRFHREYDRYLIRSFKEKHALMTAGTSNGLASPQSDTTPIINGPSSESQSQSPFFMNNAVFSHFIPSSSPHRYSPSVFTQLIRAIIYMFEMAGAYFIMLLAMYYNGYILICIFIGALLGNFLFGADTVTCTLEANASPHGIGRGAVDLPPKFVEEESVGQSLDKGMCCC